MMERFLKLHEKRPYASDMMANGQIQLMVIKNSENIATTGNVLEPKSINPTPESSSLVVLLRKISDKFKKGVS